MPHQMHSLIKPSAAMPRAVKRLVPTTESNRPSGSHKWRLLGATIRWIDLLVQLDEGLWCFPERNVDNIGALPPPKGLGWECAGGFSCPPNGKVWRNEQSTEGEALLYGPERSEVNRVLLRLEVPAQADWMDCQPIMGRRRQDMGTWVNEFGTEQSTSGSLMRRT